VPRYELNRVGHAASRRWIVEASPGVPDLGLRDLSDAEKLCALYRKAEAIRSWAETVLEGPMLTLVAAVTDDHGVQRLLESVEQDFRLLAPPVAGARRWAGKTAVSDDAAESPEQSLLESVNLLSHLQEFCLGSGSWEPVDHDGIGNIRSLKAGFVREWSPPEAGVDSLVSSRLQLVLSGAHGGGRASGPIAVHARLVKLAPAAVKDLTDLLERSGAGGVDARGIGRAVIASGDAAAAAAHREFIDAVEMMQDLASTGATATTAHWAATAERLQRCWRRWKERCLCHATLSREGRQSKGKMLQRHIANVVQYAILADGNAERPLVGQAVRCLHLLACRIRNGIKAVAPGAAAKAKTLDASHAKEVMQLHRELLDPATLAKWQEGLGADAAVCGRVIRALDRDGGQPKPWFLRDKREAVERAKILTRSSHRGRSEQFAGLLIRMQEVGLAVEVPWGYILGTDKHLPRLANGEIDYTSRQWLVNPLGVLLR
jgi:hypothetical protein